MQVGNEGFAAEYDKALGRVTWRHEMTAGTTRAVIDKISLIMKFNIPLIVDVGMKDVGIQVAVDKFARNCDNAASSGRHRHRHLLSSARQLMATAPTPLEGPGNSSSSSNSTNSTAASTASTTTSTTAASSNITTNTSNTTREEEPLLPLGEHAGLEHTASALSPPPPPPPPPSAKKTAAAAPPPPPPPFPLGAAVGGVVVSTNPDIPYSDTTCGTLYFVRNDTTGALVQMFDPIPNCTVSLAAHGNSTAPAAPAAAGSSSNSSSECHNALS
ncbi:hypothetical protein HXX76_015065 [Chlamydomonas incerta]|uniref:Uncharacterized protein n=1 Tax=Chlamydomonas incerta TaxID=51695 RepID=A0A835SB95_CHLIN|nr:hypothetical protein HXX76_015065 [Chlamydomonas incerta]|eukprot:KAG2423789.1 hypothetical protein HXX76_015065 [Chlamydomonas incerta]